MSILTEPDSYVYYTHGYAYVDSSIIAQYMVWTAGTKLIMLHSTVYP